MGVWLTCWPRAGEPPGEGPRPSKPLSGLLTTPVWDVRELEIVFVVFRILHIVSLLTCGYFNNILL